MSKKPNLLKALPGDINTRKDTQQNNTKYKSGKKKTAQSTQLTATASPSSTSKQKGWESITTANRPAFEPSQYNIKIEFDKSYKQISPLDQKIAIPHAQSKLNQKSTELKHSAQIIKLQTELQVAQVTIQHLKEDIKVNLHNSFLLEFMYILLYFVVYLVVIYSYTAFINLFIYL